jgi:hypothetical protein
LQKHRCLDRLERAAWCRQGLGKRREGDDSSYTVTAPLRPAAGKG